MKEELGAIKRALDEDGGAISDGHRRYSLVERVENLIKVKDYFVRQTDIARMALKEIGAIKE